MASKIGIAGARARGGISPAQEHPGGCARHHDAAEHPQRSGHQEGRGRMQRQRGQRDGEAVGLSRTGQPTTIQRDDGARRIHVPDEGGNRCPTWPANTRKR